jgi:hypothetical protein
MQLTLVGSPFVAKQESTDRNAWQIINRLTGEMVGWVKGGRADARDKLRRTEKERTQDHAVTS